MRFKRNRSESEWDKIARPSATLSIGHLGENLAAQYLENLNYRMVAKNFSAPIGTNSKGRRISGEIDLIAYDESQRPFTLCFIEVKTRTTTDVARPETSVDLRKQRYIYKVAQAYRRIMNVSEEPYRYDVVAIVLPGSGPGEITLLRDFFDEQKFFRRKQGQDIS